MEYGKCLILHRCGSDTLIKTNYVSPYDSLHVYKYYDPLSDSAIDYNYDYEAPVTIRTPFTSISPVEEIVEVKQAEQLQVEQVETLSSPSIEFLSSSEFDPIIDATLSKKSKKLTKAKSKGKNMPKKIWPHPLKKRCEMVCTKVNSRVSTGYNVGPFFNKDIEYDPRFDEDLWNENCSPMNSDTSWTREPKLSRQSRLKERSYQHPDAHKRAHAPVKYVDDQSNPISKYERLDGAPLASESSTSSVALVRETANRRQSRLREREMLIRRSCRGRILEHSLADDESSTPTSEYA